MIRRGGLAGPVVLTVAGSRTRAMSTLFSSVSGEEGFMGRERRAQRKDG